MVSKWKPGTRVRVVTPSDPELHGWLGTVEEVNYAAWMPATSVVLDRDDSGQGAWFSDDELEEVPA